MHSLESTSNVSPADGARSAPTGRVRNDRNPWEFFPFLEIVVVVFGAASLANVLSPPTLPPTLSTSPVANAVDAQTSGIRDAIAEKDLETSAASTTTAAGPIPRPRPISPAASESG